MSNRGESSGASRLPRSSQAFLDNRNNFDESAAPTKVIYYNSCTVDACNVGWAAFPAEVTEGTFQKAFAERTPTVQVEVDGANCLVDFQRMLLLDIVGGHERSIAWIDADGRMFKPERLVTCDGTLDRPANLANSVRGGVRPAVPDLNQPPPVEEEESGERDQ